MFGLRERHVQGPAPRGSVAAVAGAQGTRKAQGREDLPSQI